MSRKFSRKWNEYSKCYAALEHDEERFAELIEKTKDGKDSWSRQYHSVYVNDLKRVKEAKEVMYQLAVTERAAAGAA